MHPSSFPIHGFGIQRKAHIRHEDLPFPAWVLGAPSSIQSIMVHIHLITVCPTLIQSR
ncbi:hypothetical protein LINPERHAP1_LOCUS4294, partial [Linum perenne]